MNLHLSTTRLINTWSTHIKLLQLKIKLLGWVEISPNNHNSYKRYTHIEFKNITLLLSSTGGLSADISGDIFTWTEPLKNRFMFTTNKRIMEDI